MGLPRFCIASSVKVASCWHSKWANWSQKMCHIFNTNVSIATGRIWNHRRAGGHKRNFRMIDFCRIGGTVKMPEDGVIVEKIDKIEYDPNRTARIALVASGEHKRYVIATENMKSGDIIKSTQVLTRSPGNSIGFWRISFICECLRDLEPLHMSHTTMICRCLPSWQTTDRQTDASVCAFVGCMLCDCAVMILVKILVFLFRFVNLNVGNDWHVLACNSLPNAEKCRQPFV